MVTGISWKHAVQIRLKQAAKSAERARTSASSIPASGLRSSASQPDPQSRLRSQQCQDLSTPQLFQQQVQGQDSSQAWGSKHQQQQHSQSQQQPQQQQQQQPARQQQPQQQHFEQGSPDAASDQAQHGHTRFSAAEHEYQRPSQISQATTNRKAAAAEEGVAGVLGSDPPSVAPEPSQVTPCLP